MLGNLKLSTRILLQGVIITICFSLLLAWLYPKIRNTMYEEKELKTKHVVESVWGILDYYSKQAKAKVLSDEQAKKNGKGSC